MKNQRLDPQRKKKMTQLVGKFIKELGDIKTVEGLRSLLIKLIDFSLQDKAESRWAAKRLSDMLKLLARSEKSYERRIVYKLVLNTVTLAMSGVDILDKLDKLDELRNDIENTVEDMFR